MKSAYYAVAIGLLPLGGSIANPKALYLRCLGNFVPCLEAQKSRCAIEGEMAQSETNVLVALFATYKALGVGWLEPVCVLERALP